MSVPASVIWEIQPHTLAKHEILRRYLGAWFPILGKYHKRLVYIDGFCGPGRYAGGEPGSPLIALQTAYSHWKKGALRKTEIVFLFIDNDTQRIDNLRQEIDGLPFSVPPRFRVLSFAGNFEDVMENALDSLELKHSQIAPTFAFIDPFGFEGVPFGVIKRLLGYPHTEVFINLQTDSVNRWVNHPNGKIRTHMDQMFCFDDFSATLSSISSAAPIKRRQVVRLLYQGCLKKEAKYVRFFEMRDRSNRLVYHLFFASNNSLGFLKMKEAFWKVDADSGYVFSDATDPNQLKLFNADPSPGLANDLAKRYNGKKRVRYEVIEKFVIEETDYLPKHCKAALRLLEAEGSIHPLPVREDGSKRRKGSFPKGTLIDFD